MERLRRFQLVRETDVTGISGTGIVAEGVEFTNGWCTIVWLTEVNSMGFYPSIKNVELIHGHEGATKVSWLD